MKISSRDFNNQIILFVKEHLIPQFNGNLKWAAAFVLSSLSIPDISSVNSFLNFMIDNGEVDIDKLECALKSAFSAKDRVEVNVGDVVRSINGGNAVQKFLSDLININPIVIKFTPEDSAKLIEHLKRFVENSIQQHNATAIQ